MHEPVPVEAPVRVMAISVVREGAEDRMAEGFSGAGGLQFGEWLSSRGIGTFSLFRHGRLLFAYAEYRDASAAAGGEPFWDAERLALLEPWPAVLNGGPDRYAQRMNDVFHDDRPMSDVPWRRPGEKPRRKVGSLTRLKPDRYASYVHLHYLLQEEQPRGFNKYYTIGSLGTYLFSYQELPDVVEPARPGCPASGLVPADWQAAMAPHFEPWTADADAGTGTGEEKAAFWRELELVFSLEEG